MPWVPMRDGESIYVRTLGKGEPAVFLHGFGMHSAHWLPFLLPLARQYRLILPDMRGFGRSAGVRHNRACVLSNYADDLRDLANHFGLDHFPLAGISMGAFVSLQYFRLYPDHRVRAYLNIDQSPHVITNHEWPFGLFGADGQGRFRLLRDLYQGARAFHPDVPFERLPEAFRQAFLQELSEFIGYAVSNPKQRQWVRQLWRYPRLANQVLPASQWQAYTTCLGAYLQEDYDMRPLLKELDIPVWVMAGMKSEMYPWEGQKFMADACLHGRFIPFRRSGHMPMLDEPLKFIRTSRDFMALRAA